MKKRIAIYGSTGSIGTQALEVIENNPELFSLEVLTAHSNATLLIEQAIRFQPNIVIISDETKYAEVNQALASKDIKVFAGEKSLIDIAGSDTYDVLLAAIVGYAGLSSTLAAIEQGKTVALANKETLVVAKITLDSASHMNKGLEMIEAKWLFGLQNEQIEVLIHSQSIIHSMVQFEDGSVKAQMGLPDMKLPIQYALAYPQRIKNNFKRLDFKN